MEIKTMRRSKKTIITALLLVTAMLISMAGCGGKKETGPRICELYFLSKTGNTWNPNFVDISTFGVRTGPDYNNRSGRYEKFDESWLTSEDAKKLIEVICAMPDLTGDSQNESAFVIKLRYQDKDEQEFSLEKKGYGAFPENWNEIVDLVNKVTHDLGEITKRTEITKIDAEFLRKSFDVDESLLPSGVTLDDYIEISGLSYEDLFAKNTRFRFEDAVNDFTYKYLNIGSFRLYDNTEAAASSKEELEAYAEAKLDTIMSRNDYCIAGNYHGKYYEIVRFDSVDEWKKEAGITGDVMYPDGSLNFQIWKQNQGDDTSSSTEFQVYVEPECRFLIITHEYYPIDYREIDRFLHR